MDIGQELGNGRDVRHTVSCAVVVVVYESRWRLMLLGACFLGLLFILSSPLQLHPIGRKEGRKERSKDN